MLADAYQPKDTRRGDAARQQLAALFGEDSDSVATHGSSDQATAELQRLFGIDDKPASTNTGNDDTSAET